MHHTSADGHGLRMTTVICEVKLSLKRIKAITPVTYIQAGAGSLAITSISQSKCIVTSMCGYGLADYLKLGFAFENEVGFVVALMDV